VLRATTSGSKPHAECTAEQAYSWSKGKAIYAAGVQFAPVHYKGQTFLPGQANNFYIFPAVGMAIFATQAKRVTDEMFIEAGQAVADQVAPELLKQGLASVVASREQPNQPNLKYWGDDCAGSPRFSLQLQLRPESSNKSAPSNSAHIGIVLNHRLDQEGSRKHQYVELDAVLGLPRRHTGEEELRAKNVSHIAQRHRVVKAQRQRRRCRPEITPHNWISEQSCAGMPDKGLGIAGIGLEHLEAAVAGHVGDLD
jgi:Malic enzyme, NAD binding domain